MSENITLTCRRSAWANGLASKTLNLAPHPGQNRAPGGATCRQVAQVSTGRGFLARPLASPQTGIAAFHCSEFSDPASLRPGRDRYITSGRTPGYLLARSHMYQACDTMRGQLSGQCQPSRG